ncbi:double zinc ribbon domain-containing protein, partial [Macellibacteroides fermentans]
MKLWNDLLHLFFPRLCLLCDEPLVEGEKTLCLSCLYSLP